MKKNDVGLLLLGQVVVFAACSPQDDLRHRLKEADRVIYAHNYENLSISITGEEVKSIIRAIASGKKESPLVSATPALRLEFFRSTEHLASITNSGSVFWIGNTHYSDTTGTLQALYPRLRDERHRRGR